MNSKALAWHYSVLRCDWSCYLPALALTKCTPECVSQDGSVLCWVSATLPFHPVLSHLKGYFLLPCHIMVWDTELSWLESPLWHRQHFLLPHLFYTRENGYMFVFLRDMVWCWMKMLRKWTNSKLELLFSKNIVSSSSLGKKLINSFLVYKEPLNYDLS